MTKYILSVFILILAASGVFYWFSNQESAPAVSPTASATPDITLNWQTYASQSYGFSIKYPQNWQLKEIPSATGLSLQLSSQEMVEKKYTPIEVLVLTNRAVDAYLAQLLRMNHPKIKTESQSSLGGLAAKQVRVQPSSRSKPYLDTYIITQNGAHAYGLKCHDAIGDPCDYSVFEAMAGSFVFIPAP
jgi:hypothetical protein